MYSKSWCAFTALEIWFCIWLSLAWKFTVVSAMLLSCSSLFGFAFAKSCFFVESGCNVRFPFGWLLERSSSSSASTRQNGFVVSFTAEKLRVEEWGSSPNYGDFIWYTLKRSDFRLRWLFARLSPSIVGNSCRKRIFHSVFFFALNVSDFLVLGATNRRLFKLNFGEEIWWLLFRRVESGLYLELNSGNLLVVRISKAVRKSLRSKTASRLELTWWKRMLWETSQLRWNAINREKACFKVS